jgi:hypothetical protein
LSSHYYCKSGLAEFLSSFLGVFYRRVQDAVMGRISD